MYLKKNMEQFKAHSILSKKRYAELVKELELQLDNSTVDKVLTIIKTVMKFDPEGNTYDVLKERIEKSKEEGISSYIALKQKEYYEKHKDRINQVRREKRKLLKENTVL